MDELTSILAKVEFVADQVIDAKAQIVHLDAKRHKNREAIQKLGQLPKQQANKKQWLCIGSMFMKLPTHTAKNLISDDQVELNSGIDKLHDKLKEKVEQLHTLEGKQLSSGFKLKPLTKDEILAFRSAFKL